MSLIELAEGSGAIIDQGEMGVTRPVLNPWDGPTLQTTRPTSPKWSKRNCTFTREYCSRPQASKSNIRCKQPEMVPFTQASSAGVLRVCADADLLPLRDYRLYNKHPPQLTNVWTRTTPSVSKLSTKPLNRLLVGLLPADYSNRAVAIFWYRNVFISPAGTERV